MEDNSKISAILDVQKYRQLERQTGIGAKNIIIVTTVNISQTHCNQCQCVNRHELQ